MLVSSQHTTFSLSKKKKKYPNNMEGAPLVLNEKRNVNNIYKKEGLDKYQTKI